MAADDAHCALMRLAGLGLAAAAVPRLVEGQPAVFVWGAPRPAAWSERPADRAMAAIMVARAMHDRLDAR